MVRISFNPTLERRKGGGGGGRSSGGGGGRSSSGGGRSSGGSSGSRGSTTTKGGSKGGSTSTGSSSRGSSVSKGKGAKPAFYNSPSANSFNFGSTYGTKTSALPYSFGGGKPFALGSSSPFPGRTAAGGTRFQVYGNSRYGSGYPYGGYGSYVTGRPFPFLFFPIHVTPYDYYGSHEYRQVNDSMRPGGNLVEAIVQPMNNTGNVTYRIVGDNSSVTAVYAALVSNCTIANSSTAISSFTPSNTTYPLPEQIIMWYRASSFALSLDSYNNSAALASNMPPSNSTPALPLSSDSPLPNGLNTTLLSCLNSTIGQSIPLLDAPKTGLTPAILAIIIVSSIVGFILLVYGGVLVFIKCRSRRRSSRSWKTGLYEKVSLTDT